LAQLQRQLARKVVTQTQKTGKEEEIKPGQWENWVKEQPF
jgi:hypothetical protein